MRDYRTLDAIVVTWALALLTYAVYALVEKAIPQANLPILSGIVTGSVCGLLGLYAGARWGNKKDDHSTPPPGSGAVTRTLNATGSTDETVAAKD